MRHFIHVKEGEESDLQAAVATRGPVSVLIDASRNLFRVKLKITPQFRFYHLYYSFIKVVCSIYLIVPEVV